MSNKSISIFLFISCLISGCVLEEGRDRGEKCPPTNASENAVLKYIGDADCDKGECSKYLDSNGFCPVDFRECGYDAKDDYYFCSKMVCNDDEHGYEDKCEKDSENACGSHENNCRNENVGWKTGYCVDKKCEAASCENGYELLNGKCQKKKQACEKDEHLISTDVCEKNSLNNCGSHGYSCQNQDGWREGTCSPEGRCLASACALEDGYILNQSDKTCVLLRCDAGEHAFLDKCEADSLENCGKHENSCQKKVGWLNGICDKGSCSVSECQKGYQLVNHKCIPLIPCSDNQHVYETVCEDNSIEHCQSHTDNCTTLMGWASGDCLNGQCVIETCQTGYCLASEGYCINSEENRIFCTD